MPSSLGEEEARGTSISKGAGVLPPPPKVKEEVVGAASGAETPNGEGAVIVGGVDMVADECCERRGGLGLDEETAEDGPLADALDCSPSLCFGMGLMKGENERSDIWYLVAGAGSIVLPIFTVDWSTSLVRQSGAMTTI